MMKIFDISNDTITTQITVTNGFFDGGVGTLAGSNLSTSSLSATQKSTISIYHIIQKTTLVYLMDILMEVVVQKRIIL